MYLLLVDDDSAVLDVMVLILEANGLTTVGAVSAESALAALAERRPDLLVTDLSMTDMDGIALAEHARATWPGLPVLFVAGDTPRHLLAYQAKNPGTSVLSKPFDATTLVRAVRSALSAPGG